MNIEFELVSNDMYRVKNSEELVSFVDSKLDDISLGDMYLFEDMLNNDLKDKILARVVAVIFNRTYTNTFNEARMFVTIKVAYDNREVIVTTGALNIDNNTKLLSGVLYK